MQIRSDNATTLIEKEPVLLDRFEVIRVLGKGAAGAVYQVRDREEQGREVALKVLVNESAFDENTLERFKIELKLCQQLRHPHIVQAYNLIELENTIAFTMEYVDGEDLGRLLKEESVPYNAIDALFTQLLSALDTLHAHGVLHRDLKLENILLSRDGVVKVSDLGLAKRANHKGITRSGVLLGTAQYMPPEYITAGIYDLRGDLYAAGILLYELLTGQRRLRRVPANKVIEHLIQTKFDVPREPLVGVHAKYKAILDRALATNPVNRFQSALEMRAAFLKDDGPLVEQPLQGLQSSKIGVLDWIQQAVLAHPLYTAACLASCCALLVIGITLSFISQTVSFSDLEHGTYVGRLTVQKGVNNHTSKLSAQVGASGIFFLSGIQSCASGFFSFKTKELDCQGVPFDLEVDQITSEQFQGTITDVRDGTAHRFIVDKLG